MWTIRTLDAGREMKRMLRDKMFRLLIILIISLLLIAVGWQGMESLVTFTTHYTQLVIFSSKALVVIFFVGLGMAVYSISAIPLVFLKREFFFWISLALCSAAALTVIFTVVQGGGNIGILMACILFIAGIGMGHWAHDPLETRASSTAEMEQT